MSSKVRMMNYDIEVAMHVLRMYAPHSGMGDSVSRDISQTEKTLIDNAAELVNDYLLKVGRFTQQPLTQQQIDTQVLSAYASMFGGPK